MARNEILKVVKEIKQGKTFYRSSLPQTVENKYLWEEIKSEVHNGFSIDLPKVNSQRGFRCA